MERETGIEPATFSLGRQQSILTRYLNADRAGCTLYIGTIRNAYRLTPELVVFEIQNEP